MKHRIDASDRPASEIATSALKNSHFSVLPRNDVPGIDRLRLDFSHQEQPSCQQAKEFESVSFYWCYIEYYIK